MPASLQGLRDALLYVLLHNLFVPVVCVYIVFLKISHAVAATFPLCFIEFEIQIQWDRGRVSGSSQVA